jgi:hypothetical protein
MLCGVRAAVPVQRHDSVPGKGVPSHADHNSRARSISAQLPGEYAAFVVPAVSIG